MKSSASESKPFQKLLQSQNSRARAEELLSRSKLKQEFLTD